MSAPSTARLATVPGEFLEDATPVELEDWLSYLDPSIVAIPGETRLGRPDRRVQAGTEDDIVCFDPAGESPLAGPTVIDGVQFVFAPTLASLCELERAEGAALAVDEPTYVVSDQLELAVDTTTLSATLTGRESYREALSPTALSGEYVHVSTALPSGYRRTWDDLTVVGAGLDRDRMATQLPALDCRTDGRVCTHTVQRSRLGLTAIRGVGQSRAEQLREAGLDTRSAVAETEYSTLERLGGLGEATAGRIRHGARAIERDQLIRLTDEPLPNGEPVFVDIETDGLDPTIIWLIGVLDGSSEDGTYHSFLQTDPDDPGGALTAFLDWYSANASHRPLVAYNGWSFDFPVIHEHLLEYRPASVDDWTSTDRFDPYRWAIEAENAVLPGLTNRLADVAAALGHERSSGLTGGAVARTYQRWMAERSPQTEPDWDRFVRYCEADVRSLAVVYEAIADSDRIVSRTELTPDIGATTAQGQLSDW